MFDEVELDAALASIAEEVSCSVRVPDHFEADRLAVTIDGEVVPSLASCDDGDGWTEEPGAVRLCQNTCLAAQTAQTVEATLSCIPEP